MRTTVAEDLFFIIRHNTIKEWIRFVAQNNDDFSLIRTKFFVWAFSLFQFALKARQLNYKQPLTVEQFLVWLYVDLLELLPFSGHHQFQEEFLFFKVLTEILQNFSSNSILYVQEYFHRLILQHYCALAIFSFPTCYWSSKSYKKIKL